MDDWERKLASVKIRKEDMNRLIMNFLVTEVTLAGCAGASSIRHTHDVNMRTVLWLRGLPTSHVSQGYVEAAQTFQQESLTQPGIDLAAITDRMEIRKAVQSGNVEEAIERVNDLNPEAGTILDPAYC